MTSAATGLRPRSVRAWLLTWSACALGCVLCVVAYCMVRPVRWDGLGKLGALALFFPLHLLLFTLLSLALGWLARRSGARLAARVSVLVAILAALMALVPVSRLWLRAREWNVSLSLGTYLAQAAHMNSGAPRPERSVVYGTARDGTQLVLDVWPSGLSGSGSARPAVVIVHGGAWVHGNRGMLPDWNRWLNGLGYEVFDVEYRMPPPARWLDEIGDVKSALGWVAAHAAEYHADPARISVMGNSAGANLAMLAAYSMGDPQLPPSTDVPAVAIRSVIDVYGPTDLALLHRDCKSPDYVHAALAEYIGGSPAEFPERYRQLSPLSHVSSRSPPTITLLGGSDRLVAAEQAELLDAALRKSGVHHELYVLPACDHGFDVNWGGFGTQIARAKIQAFLEAQSRPGNGSR